MAYDRAKFEVHNNFVDDFHKNRIAFLIYNNKVNILKNSTMSHFEWFKSLGGKDENTFNLLTRGYFFEGDLVFYKGNFEYDEAFAESIKTVCEDVCSAIGLECCKIYLGLIKIKNERGFFPPDKLLGEYKNNKFKWI